MGRTASTEPQYVYKGALFFILRAGRSGDRIPVGARFSAHFQTGPGAHPASCTMGTCSFPGVNSGRGVTLTPHPLLVPLVMKEWSYTSTPPMGRTACTEPQCLYKGALYLTMFIFCQPTHFNINFTLSTAEYPYSIHGHINMLLPQITM